MGLWAVDAVGSGGVFFSVGGAQGDWWVQKLHATSAHQRAASHRVPTPRIHTNCTEHCCTQSHLVITPVVHCGMGDGGRSRKQRSADTHGRMGAGQCMAAAPTASIPLEHPLTPAARLLHAQRAPLRLQGNKAAEQGFSSYCCGCATAGGRKAWEGRGCSVLHVGAAAEPAPAAPTHLAQQPALGHHLSDVGRQDDVPAMS